jgi:hypothetical protein
MERTYRKLTLLGLAIVAINVLGRIAIADWLIENTRFSDDWPVSLARLVHDGWAIAAALFFTLGCAYLWGSSRKASQANSDLAS